MSETEAEVKSTHKIKGKFYPLQHQEFLDAAHNLTPSQFLVLYYIRTLDPHNDGIEINASQIAKALSTPQKIVHRQTVSRALKALDGAGYIDMEILTAQVKVSGRGLWCVETPVVCGDTTMDHETPRTDHETPRTDHETPRTYIDRARAQTYSDYTDFNQTLSETGEREKFLKFVLERTKNWKTPINDLEAFLASANKHTGIPEWQTYYALYQQVSRGGVATKHDVCDWRKDPRYSEWRSQVSQGPLFFQNPDGSLNSDRFECWRWAKKNDREAFAHLREAV